MIRMPRDACALSTRAVIHHDDCVPELRCKNGGAMNVSRIRATRQTMKQINYSVRSAIQTKSHQLITVGEIHFNTPAFMNQLWRRQKMSKHGLRMTIGSPNWRDTRLEFQLNHRPTFFGFP